MIASKRGYVVGLIALMMSVRAASADDAHPTKIELTGTLTLKNAADAAGSKAPVVLPPTDCQIEAGDWQSIGRPNTLVISYGHAIPPPHVQDLTCDTTGGDPSRPVECLPKNDDGERTPYFPPNQSLKVYVILPAVEDGHPNLLSTVSATPAQGTSAPGVVPASTTSKLAASENGKSYCVIDNYVLAPRPPGPFTVTASLTDSVGNAIPGSSHAIELVVDTKYIGAVRVAMGVIFPGSGARSWSVRPTASGTTAIYEDSYSPATFEVIAGYTAFFSRPTARDLAHFRLGWFTGLGVVSTAGSSSTFTAFDAVYTGPELSAAGLSLQLLIGARRDTVLADGYQVGDTISGTTVPTTTRFDVALGFSVGVTSDVFKIAGVSSP